MCESWEMPQPEDDCLAYFHAFSVNYCPEARLILSSSVRSSRPIVILPGPASRTAHCTYYRTTLISRMKGSSIAHKLTCFVLKRMSSASWTRCHATRQP